MIRSSSYYLSAVMVDDRHRTEFISDGALCSLDKGRSALQFWDYLFLLKHKLTLPLKIFLLPCRQSHPLIRAAFRYSGERDLLGWGQIPPPAFITDQSQWRRARR